jgi:hypothetical protein
MAATPDINPYDQGQCRDHENEYVQVSENEKGDDDHDDSIADLATLLREFHILALPVCLVISVYQTGALTARHSRAFSQIFLRQMRLAPTDLQRIGRRFFRKRADRRNILSS